MTLAELGGYDGRDGRAAYIAVNGTIYDVTASPHWVDGLHPPDHRAGQDLTAELAQAPHVRAVVERFPVVGTLETEAPPQARGGNGKMIIAIIVAVILGLVLIAVL